MAPTPVHFPWGQGVEIQELTTPAGCQEGGSRATWYCPRHGRFRLFCRRWPGLSSCSTWLMSETTFLLRGLYKQSFPAPQWHKDSPGVLWSVCYQLLFLLNQTTSRVSASKAPCDKQMLGLFATALPVSDLVSFLFHCLPRHCWCRLLLYPTFIASPYVFSSQQPDSNHQDIICTSSEGRCGALDSSVQRSNSNPTVIAGKLESMFGNVLETRRILLEVQSHTWSRGGGERQRELWGPEVGSGYPCWLSDPSNPCASSEYAVALMRRCWNRESRALPTAACPTCGPSPPHPGAGPPWAGSQCYLTSFLGFL